MIQTMTSRSILDWLRGRPAALEPQRNNAPGPTLPDLTEAQVIAAAQRAADLGYGRGGAHGCIVPPDLLAALAALDEDDPLPPPSD